MKRVRCIQTFSNVVTYCVLSYCRFLLVDTSGRRWYRKGQLWCKWKSLRAMVDKYVYLNPRLAYVVYLILSLLPSTVKLGPYKKKILRDSTTICIIPVVSTVKHRIIRFYGIWLLLDYRKHYIWILWILALKYEWYIAKNFFLEHLS